MNTAALRSLIEQALLLEQRDGLLAAHLQALPGLHRSLRCTGGTVQALQGFVEGYVRAVPELLDSVADEGPLAIQLFGADPLAMGEAAALAAERRPAMIDINMGCPVRKVTRRGAGAALMTAAHLATSDSRNAVTSAGESPTATPPTAA